MLVLALADLTRNAELRRSELLASALLLALPEVDAVVARWQLAETLVPALLRRLGLRLSDADGAMAGEQQR